MNNLPKVLALSIAITLAGCAEDDPLLFIQEGQVLFEKGSIKEAQVQFKNALQVNPRLAEAYYGLALIEEEEKSWPAMKKNLQDTLANDPDHIDAHIKLGLINRLAKELDLAKKHAATALKLNPDNISAIMLDASIQHEEGNKDKAMLLVEKILEKDSSNAEAILLKVSILLSDQNYDEAEAILNVGMKAHPELLGLDMLKIRLHEAQKDNDGIINAFNDLISKHSTNKTLYYSRLKALIDMDRIDQAESALREAINVFSDDVDMKLMLVTSVLRRDQAEAEKLLKEYVLAHPETYEFKSRLAGYYVDEQRIQEAEKLLKEIADANSIGQDGLKAKIQLVQQTVSP